MASFRQKPFDANVFPAASTTFMQDKLHRFSVHLGQPNGVVASKVYNGSYRSEEGRTLSELLYHDSRCIVARYVHTEYTASQHSLHSAVLPESEVAI